jgi:hypothetical protein
MFCFLWWLGSFERCLAWEVVVNKEDHPGEGSGLRREAFAPKHFGAVKNLA